LVILFICFEINNFGRIKGGKKKKKKKARRKKKKKKKARRKKKKKKKARRKKKKKKIIVIKKPSNELDKPPQYEYPQNKLDKFRQNIIMIVFFIEYEEKRIYLKSFTGTTLETIYDNFDKFCKDKCINTYYVDSKKNNFITHKSIDIIINGVNHLDKIYYVFEIKDYNIKAIKYKSKNYKIYDNTIRQKNFEQYDPEEKSEENPEEKPEEKSEENPEEKPKREKKMISILYKKRLAETVYKPDIHKPYLGDKILPYAKLILKQNWVTFIDFNKSNPIIPTEYSFIWPIILSKIREEETLQEQKFIKITQEKIPEDPKQEKNPEDPKQEKNPKQKKVNFTNLSINYYENDKNDKNDENDENDKKNIINNKIKIEIKDQIIKEKKLTVSSNSKMILADGNNDNFNNNIDRWVMEYIDNWINSNNQKIIFNDEKEKEKICNNIKSLIVDNFVEDFIKWRTMTLGEDTKNIDKNIEYEFYYNNN